MRYKLLGNSGLRVSELCLGTMTCSDDWGWGAEYDESKSIYDTFREAGGNFIDTANHYTDGTSEKFLGEFVESDRSCRCSGHQIFKWLGEQRPQWCR